MISDFTNMISSIKSSSTEVQPHVIIYWYLLYMYSLENLLKAIIKIILGSSFSNSACIPAVDGQHAKTVPFCTCTIAFYFHCSLFS